MLPLTIVPLHTLENRIGAQETFQAWAIRVQQVLIVVNQRMASCLLPWDQPKTIDGGVLICMPLWGRRWTYSFSKLDHIMMAWLWAGWRRWASTRRAICGWQQIAFRCWSYWVRTFGYGKQRFASSSKAWPWIVCARCCRQQERRGPMEE